MYRETSKSHSGFLNQGILIWEFLLGEHVLRKGIFYDVQEKNQKHLFLLSWGCYQNSKNSFELLKSQLINP